MRELQLLIAQIELMTMRVCELCLEVDRDDDESSNDREEACESLEAISADLATAADLVDLPETGDTQ